MINIFNRKELFITFSMEEQARIRDILQANSIDYKIKITDISSPTKFSDGTRGRAGSYGENTNFSKEYVIYVAKDDFEKASYIINKPI